MLVPLQYIFWLVLICLVECSSAAKILGGNADALTGSHYMMTIKLMEELASRGHEVSLVVSSTQKLKHSGKVTHKVYQVPYETGISELVAKDFIEKGFASWEVLQKLFEIENVMCESMLNNTDFLDSLKDFDLVVHDSAAHCVVLLADYLNIQRVEFMAGPPNSPFGSYYMAPMPLSYVPQMIPGYTDEMSFLQRIGNLGGYVFGQVLLSMIARNFNNIKIKYNINPENSFQEATGKAELLLITADFALEYPQPLLPGHIMVGQLNCKDAIPLSPEFEEFVNSSAHGFVIVAFGSSFVPLTKEKVDMLALAFGKLKQKVVWRLKGYIPSPLSPNIKVVEWLPQNDLLGHKDIKAFVSHVGHNSLYESAYHGVPVVAIPLFADQFFDARKVEHFGLGLSVDHNSFTSEELVEKIEYVINTPRFKTEAIRISKLLKDRPRTPLETTGDWIEYVLRHGGARHLRAQVFNIPWYQYYLLDVIAFLVAVVTVVVMVIRMACRCVCRLCCKRSGTKPKKE